MAKLTVIDNNAIAIILEGNGVRRNPDGTYEVDPNGGEITLVSALPNNTNKKGWQCDCNALFKTDAGEIFYYYKGNKLIIHNPFAVELDIYLGGNKYHYNTKLIELLLIEGSRVDIKIVDTRTGCFMCIDGGGTRVSPSQLPKAELICDTDPNKPGAHILIVTSRQQNIQVVIKDKDGAVIFNQGYSGNSRQLIGYGAARAFYYIDGIGEVQMNVPFCKPSPKD
jgi:hypothetical protein